MEMIAFGAYDTNLFIRVKATGGRCEDICAILRGLFYSRVIVTDKARKTLSLEPDVSFDLGLSP